ncbi:MAG: hypothetical protein VXY93_10765 [Pseudomonadota bacterium]|nr:hypothetical protein [Pseudomonadota bacterium]
MKEAGGERPQVVPEGVESIPVKNGITAEKHQPFNVTNGLAGVGMCHCARGKCLLVMAHDKAWRVKMRKISVTVERRQGVSLVFSTIDEAWRKRLPSPKRHITNSGCATRNMDTLAAAVALHDFGFRRNGLRPLRTKHAS